MALLLVISLPSYADTAAESSQRGRHIFFEGEKSNAEPLTANVGAASIPVPATALPCAGCHGSNGQGRPEGGVRPSDITWFNLTKEYGGITVMGRVYGAYNEDSFLRAVTGGIDSAGNKLDSSMPRYNISRRDARDLVAYLKVIQDDFDPGISNDAIVIGTLQPDVTSQARLGEAMVEVMRARFDEINRQGGVYGKRLELEVLPFQERQSFIAQSNKMINSDKVFALVNVFSSTADDSLIDTAESAGIPSIGPYTQFPAPRDGQHFFTFYLHGGLQAQIAALAQRAAEQAPGAAAFVFYAAGSGYAGIADDAVAVLKENQFADAQALAYAEDGSQRLADLVDLTAHAEPVVLFVGPSGDLVSLLGGATSAQVAPRLYLPGFFVGGDILKLSDAYAERLEMTYITVLDSGEGGKLTKFRQFMGRNKLEYNHLNARLYAYSATEILIEGAKRSGKRITRKKLVGAIEELYAFDAGLNKPVSFSSQRRTGLLGAYVVKLDTKNKRLHATGTWVRLD